jgi:hypothetical protein
VIIKYCSAPCGAGKTKAAIDLARELAEAGEKVIILQPTKRLIDNTVKDELPSRPNPPPHFVFHGDVLDEGQSVALELSEHLTNPLDTGQIVFTTHQALHHIKYLPTKGDWHVIADECPQAFREDARQIPVTHPLITNELKIDDYDSIYGAVSAKHPSKLKEMARNRADDEVIKGLKDTLNTIISPYWQTYVNREQYHKLLNGKVARLSLHSILDPKILEGFASARMIGADVEDSGIYNLWSSRGVKFQKDTEFESHLRFMEHENSIADKIIYFLDDPWSRYRMEEDIGDETVLNHMVNIASDKVKDRPCVWQGNKHMKGDLFKGLGTRMPNVPHGLNDYSHIDQIVFLSSLNPTPEHGKFLKHFGMTAEDIRRATYRSVVYQSVLRTSLRDPACTRSRTIIVPDAPVANYLAERLPGAQLFKWDLGLPKKEPTKIGRPRKHASGAAKARAYRQQQAEALRRKLLDGLRQLAQDHIEEGCRSKDIDEYRIETTIDSKSSFDTEVYRGTIYKNINSSNPLGYLSCGTEQVFIDFLTDCHYRILKTKDENWLVSPAIFDPNKKNEEGTASTRRGKANIVCVRHIWLDFENGDLTPEEFAELFPSVEMLIFNSFNHTKEKPRFRVVMLTTQAVTAEVHELMFDMIEAKLKDAGYVAKPKKGSSFKKSGLDRSKRPATSLFYLPCQAKNPADSFAYHANKSGQRPIDPLLWILHVDLTPQEPKTETVSKKQTTEPGVDQAIAEWRQSSASPGEGNDRFYSFALSLKKAGMDAGGIRQTLRAEATFGRSPGERRNQISSIMHRLFGGQSSI